MFTACPHTGRSLAVDARGGVHVGWYTGKEGRQGLWHARSDDEGRTFGTPVALVTGPDVPPSQVALSADGGGVLAAWDDRPSRDGRRVALARIGADGGMVRVQGGEGPDPRAGRARRPRPGRLVPPPDGPRRPDKRPLNGGFQAEARRVSA